MKVPVSGFAPRKENKARKNKEKGFILFFHLGHGLGKGLADPGHGLGASKIVIPSIGLRYLGIGFVFLRNQFPAILV